MEKPVGENERFSQEGGAGVSVEEVSLGHGPEGAQRPRGLDQRAPWAEVDSSLRMDSCPGTEILRSWMPGFPHGTHTGCSPFPGLARGPNPSSGPRGSVPGSRAIPRLGTKSALSPDAWMV